jgi:hypothetical protein
MVSILFDLLSSEKSSTAPYKSWKKISSILAYRVSKGAEFCADFKNVQKSRVWQKGKKFYRKTEFVKSSNKIETAQYFKKRFFIN